MMILMSDGKQYHGAGAAHKCALQSVLIPNQGCPLRSLGSRLGLSTGPLCTC